MVGFLSVRHSGGVFSTNASLRSTHQFLQLRSLCKGVSSRYLAFEPQSLGSIYDDIYSPLGYCTISPCPKRSTSFLAPPELPPHRYRPAQHPLPQPLMRKPEIKPTPISFISLIFSFPSPSSSPAPGDIPFISLVLRRRQIHPLLPLTHGVPRPLSPRVTPHVVRLHSENECHVVHDQAKQDFVTGAVKWLVVSAVDLEKSEFLLRGGMEKGREKEELRWTR